MRLPTILRRFEIVRANGLAQALRAGLLLPGLLLLGGVGCAVAPALQDAVGKMDGHAASSADRLNIQRDLMNVADDLMTAVADVYGKVVNSADDWQSIQYAQGQRLEIATAALDNAVNVNPLAGLMDTVVLLTLARAEADRPSSREALGDGYPAVAAMLRAQEATVTQAVSRYLTREQMDELHKSIDQWRAGHPDQSYATHVRLVDFMASRPQKTAGSTPPGSIFSLLFLDPLAGINPAVREIAQSRDIAERMFFYGQRLPLLLSWRIEGVHREMLATPRMVKIQDQLAEMTETSSRFTDVAAGFSLSFEQLPEKTEVAADHFAQTLAAAGTTAIRTATTQLSAEREAAVDQMAVRLQQQQEEAVRNLEAALDRSMATFHKRVLRLSLVLIAIFFAALLLYQLVLRRLLPRSSSAPVR